MMHCFRPHCRSIELSFLCRGKLDATTYSHTILGDNKPDLRFFGCVVTRKIGELRTILFSSYIHYYTFNLSLSSMLNSTSFFFFLIIVSWSRWSSSPLNDRIANGLALNENLVSSMRRRRLFASLQEAFCHSSLHHGKAPRLLLLRCDCAADNHDESSMSLRSRWSCPSPARFFTTGLAVQIPRSNSSTNLRKRRAELSLSVFVALWALSHCDKPHRASSVALLQATISEWN